MNERARESWLKSETLVMQESEEQKLKKQVGKLASEEASWQEAEDSMAAMKKTLQASSPTPKPRPVPTKRAGSGPTWQVAKKHQAQETLVAQKKKKRRKKAEEGEEELDEMGVDDDRPHLKVGFREGMIASYMRLARTTLGVSICSIQDVFDAAKPVLFPGGGGSHFTPQRGYVSFQMSTCPGQLGNVRLENLSAGTVNLRNLVDVTFTNY